MVTDLDRSAVDDPPTGGSRLRQRDRQPPARGPSAGADRRTQTGPSRRPRGPLYAALDLGTNNCRLLIARPHENTFRVLDGFTRIVRLGEGLSSTGRLSDAAMTRTLEALRLCRNKLREHEPTRMRLIATEACRAAANGAEFIARVETELGLALEIVDRRTEAELAVTGCADLIEKDSAGALMFDIGGGSSELAWLDFRGGRPRRQGKTASSIRSWQSLPVGVVSIAEKFGGVEVSSETFEAMVAYVASFLSQFRGRERLRQMIAEHPVHLIGTSGTVTTLAGLHLGLERYERQKVDGLWMTRQQVDDTMKALLGMSFERRVSHPCIGRDRADLVLPGCAIFEAIRREWPTDRVRVADRGLREGILISLMDADRSMRAGGQMGKR
ncbi:exopolyphosphatase / guanosine-5'-triphosphate,3'-diphosphate pyrophosphatase [Devosia enhydra]|uniref:Exopolyphosphatase / guanosine-5'-triphosphate,3'-diphosphate pyrophosphatase n=1 Tax=Devosia enhydra TaxID=665118 RepID=A0A1K2HTS2_9HYPH|nr:exopolyphosphatase / guanosine-5'-triphosphate,3'-diphosphate pyrophosphatase [Devosia enhydra]